MRRCGNVLRATILEAPDGRSKGCGLVEYSNPSEARRACDELTDADLGGRHVFVREDREAVAPPTSGSGRGAGGPASSSSTTTSVFVGNLAYEVAWQDLKDHMRGAGDVAHAEVLKQRDGRSKGCGLVEYVHYRDAQRALRELDGTTLMGRDLFVQPDERRGGGGGGFGGGAGRSSAASAAEVVAGAEASAGAAAAVPANRAASPPRTTPACSWATCRTRPPGRTSRTSCGRQARWQGPTSCRVPTADRRDAASWSSSIPGTRPGRCGN